MYRPNYIYRHLHTLCVCRLNAVMQACRFVTATEDDKDNRQYTISGFHILSIIIWDFEWSGF